MLGSIQDYDREIAVHATRVKRVLVLLFAISFVCLMFNPFSLLSFLFNAALLLTAYVGAHKLRPGLLMFYAVVKGSLLLLGVLSVLVMAAAVLVYSAEAPQPDYDEVHMTQPTFVAYTAFVAGTTVVAIAYLSLMVHAIRLSLRLRAHIIARRMLAEFDAPVPSKLPQPVPEPVAYPMPMPAPLSAYPGQPVPMYSMVPAVPLPQDVTPQPAAH